MLPFMLLLSSPMDRKVAFRLRILQLIGLGVAQKAIAHRLQISEGTMNRWLNEGAEHATMDHEDRLDLYLCDLQREISRDYNQTPQAELDRLHAKAETSRAMRRLKTPRRAAPAAPAKPHHAPKVRRFKS